MAKHHPANERIKRRYLIYLQEANQMAESSIDQVAAAISAFEKSAGYKDFKQFHIEKARRFKRQLIEYTNPETGKGLAKSTIHSRLMAVKAFFKWLAGQPGYKSRIRYSDADYFNSSANDERIAKAVRERLVPTVQQILHTLRSMPVSTLLERRDRALVAFTLLSGARDNAVASMKLRHLDLKTRSINQDAREVRTKTRKTFVSVFFPVGEEVERIVSEWIAELESEQLFGPGEPLFPSTEIGLNEAGHFTPVGLSRQHWANAGPIRKIFKAAFENAGLPYFNPHSFRKTLVSFGQSLCRTPEELKAWSQNLGHEDVLTTLRSYGVVARDRQAEILSSLGRSDNAGTIRLDAQSREVLERLLRT
jgi:integrase